MFGRLYPRAAPALAGATGIERLRRKGYAPWFLEAKPFSPRRGPITKARGAAAAHPGYPIRRPFSPRRGQISNDETLRDKNVPETRRMTNCLDNTCPNKYHLPMVSKTTGIGRRFDTLEQEAFLGLWRTYDRLRALEDELFARYDLTPSSTTRCGCCGVSIRGRSTRSILPHGSSAVLRTSRGCSTSSSSAAWSSATARPTIAGSSGRHHGGRHRLAQRAARADSRLPRSATRPPRPQRPEGAGRPPARAARLPHEDADSTWR